MFQKKDRGKLKYTFAHWCAFQMTSLNCGAWRLKYLFHDIEKPILKFFLPYEKVQSIHRRNNKHHPEWLENRLRKESKKCGNGLGSYQVDKLLNEYDYKGTIIDWESGHFTKEGKPLSACEEYNKLLSHDTFQEKYPFIERFSYNEFSRKLMDAIKELGLYHIAPES